MKRPNVIVVTTLPNAAIALQISPQAFQARINVAKAALEADIKEEVRIVALCEQKMFPHFASFSDSVLTESEAQVAEFPGNDPAHRVMLVEDPGLQTTMGYGRRRVISVAANILRREPNTASLVPVIIWREPEKDIARFIDAICEPLITGQADIVIPRRKSLASYPKFSQDWEATGSMMASFIIGGEPQDYWVGPRAFNLAAARYFLEYPGEQTSLPDWHDCIFGPIVDAVMHCLRVTGVKIDFEYPAEQRDAEENDAATMTKRMAVMHKLLKAIDDRMTWNLSQD